MSEIQDMIRATVEAQLREMRAKRELILDEAFQTQAAIGVDGVELMIVEYPAWPGLMAWGVACRWPRTGAV